MRCSDSDGEEREEEEEEASTAASPSAPSRQDRQRQRDGARPTVYFLWGTDHKDQQLLNARKMQKMLPPRLRCDWQAQVLKAATSKKGSLLNLLLGKKRPSSSLSAEAVAPSTSMLSPPSSCRSFSSNSHKKEGLLLSFINAAPSTLSAGEDASSCGGGGEKSSR